MPGIRTYQLTELFGWFTYPSAADEGNPIECLVCGAAVANADRHQKWHNSSPMNTYTAPLKEPIPKTREEMAEFATEWDRKVEEGRNKND